MRAWLNQHSTPGHTYELIVEGETPGQDPAADRAGGRLGSRGGHRVDRGSLVG